jgi:hypothetical protein
LKIPPFGALYKNKIKIAQCRLLLTWKIEKEEEMHFQKRQAYNKKTTPKFLPAIPLLLPTKLSSDELKDKAAYITFTLQVRSKGRAPQEPRLIGRASGPLRKMRPPAVDGSHHRVERNLGSEFNHGSDGHVEHCSGCLYSREIVLRHMREAAMEDNRTDPEDESLMVPMTEQHIDDALLAVTNPIFPYRALKRQKQWMSKYTTRKPTVQNGSKSVCHLNEPD